MHHIVSRGAGGTDDDWNLLSLCRRCHADVHQIGWVRFVARYPRAEAAVRKAREMAGRPVESRDLPSLG
jgi:5-methylcytosine-specific restriction endonuclease McrA